MNKVVPSIYLALITVTSASGQDLQKGEMYIPILNGTQNPVNITVAILDGSTSQQKLFLAELAASPKKATFIANNLNNQGFQTLNFTSPTIDWVTTSTNWPQVQTIVLYGTTTLNEHVNSYNVTNQYTFAGWGSTELQPNMKLQGTLAGLSFTDYSPPDPSSFGATSDTAAPHPVPNDQIEQQERQQAEILKKQEELVQKYIMGVWQPSTTWLWDEPGKVADVITGNLTISVDPSGQILASGKFHFELAGSVYNGAGFQITREQGDYIVDSARLRKVSIEAFPPPAENYNSVEFEDYARSNLCLLLGGNYSIVHYDQSGTIVTNYEKNWVALEFENANFGGAPLSPDSLSTDELSTHPNVKIDTDTLAVTAGGDDVAVLGADGWLNLLLKTATLTKKKVKNALNVLEEECPRKPFRVSKSDGNHFPPNCDGTKASALVSGRSVFWLCAVSD